MCRNGLLILITIVVNSLPVVLLAQSKEATDINFTNIYNTQYTCIGIPVRDSVYVYAPPSSKSPTNWFLIDRLAIPEGTIAMDGNIGKNMFMTREMVIFEESGQYDTLHFNSELPSINPRLWVRTPHSTEPESYFLSGEKNVCYYREYNEAELRLKWYKSDQLSPYMFKENRTRPVLTDQDGFHKLYSYIASGGMEYLAAVFKHRISFYRYPMVQDSLLGDAIIEPADLNFPLPQGTITAFIYDFKYIAVVLQEQTVFYGFDKEQKKWIQNSNIPPFRFADMSRTKK